MRRLLTIIHANVTHESISAGFVRADKPPVPSCGGRCSWPWCSRQHPCPPGVSSPGVSASRSPRLVGVLPAALFLRRVLTTWFEWSMGSPVAGSRSGGTRSSASTAACAGAPWRFIDVFLPVNRSGGDGSSLSKITPLRPCPRHVAIRCITIRLDSPLAVERFLDSVSGVERPRSFDVGLVGEDRAASTSPLGDHPVAVELDDDPGHPVRLEDVGAGRAQPAEVRARCLGQSSGTSRPRPGSARRSGPTSTRSPASVRCRAGRMPRAALPPFRAPATV